MDNLEPYRRGYLLTPPQGMLKRTWQKKYYAIYEASHFGIERVEIFDSEDHYQRHQSAKIVPLNDCIKVFQSPQKNQHNVFEVVCKNQVYQFSAETTQDMADWISSFQNVAFQQRRDSHNAILQSSHDLQQEENFIYSSISGPEVHVVQVVKTEASERSNLWGTYQLTIGPLNIMLSTLTTSQRPSKILYTWAYHHIRRFSRTKETFSFEAGRKCASGEGMFTFESKEGNAIFQSVGMYLKNFKKHSPLPAIRDLQSETRTVEKRRSMHTWPSHASEPPTVSSNRKSGEEKASDLIYENTVVGKSKLRPPILKPPRKNKLPSTSSRLSTSLDSVPSLADTQVTTDSGLASFPPSLAKVVDSQPSQDSIPSIPSKPMPIIKSDELLYDLPEERKDAWKTFGFQKDNIHEEKMPDDVGALYASVDVTTLSTRSFLKRHISVPETARPINLDPEAPIRQISLFTPRTTSDGSYDRLFQFTVPNKNVASDHIYKKLNVTVSNEATEKVKETNASIMNEYAEPEIIAIENQETAKPISVDENSEDDAVKHFVQNNEVYSVVVKPTKTPTVQQGKE